jgi:hypothetical protein
MTTPAERENERDLARRRAQELKDLETESDHGERPLEGFSGARTTWTEDQDEAAAPEVHGGDEATSRQASLDQVPPAPADRALPERAEDEGG